MIYEICTLKAYEIRRKAKAYGLKIIECDLEGLVVDGEPENVLKFLDSIDMDPEEIASIMGNL